jgi:hypothetical protein
MQQPMQGWTLQLVLHSCQASLLCLCSGAPGLVAAWLLLMRRLLRVLSAWA